MNVLFIFTVYSLLNKALVSDERNRHVLTHDVSISSNLGRFDVNLDLESSQIIEARLKANYMSLASDDGVCKLPQLEYEGLHNDSLPVRECRIKQNWGYIDRDTREWRLNENARQAFARTECQFRKIYRVDDFKINMSEFMILNEGDKIMHDVVEVKCQGHLKSHLKQVYKSNQKQIRFETLFPQIIPELEPNVSKQLSRDRKVSEDADCEPMNVILMSYDSVSRVSWINRLKKSYYYAMEEMKFDWLNGYNIVGDGTPAGEKHVHN